MNDSNTNIQQNIVHSSEVTALISDDVVALFNFILILLVPVLAAPGVVFNIINLIVFTRMGLTDTINISLLGLSVADTIVLLTMLGYCVLFNPLTISAAPSADIIYAVDFLILGTPHVLFSRISGLLTGVVSLERLACVVCPLRVKTLITRRRTSVVVCGAYALIISCSIPMFVAHTIGRRLNPALNATVVGLILGANAEALESLAIGVNVTAQMTSFLVVSASTFLLTRSLHLAARWRGSIARQVSVAPRREKQLIKMVVFMSAVFIVCSFPTVMVNALMQFFPEFSLKGREKNLFVLTCGVFFVLQSTNATANTFIYLSLSSKFKRSFYSMFGLASNLSQHLNNTKFKDERNTVF